MNANLKAKTQDWWDNLDYDYKIKLMETLSPDEAHLIEADEMWDMMDWEERYEVYCGGTDSKDEVEPNYDGGVMSNFDNENPNEDK